MPLLDLSAEEEEVARLDRLGRDRGAVEDLLGRISRENHAPGGEGRLDQPGAIDPPGGHAAPLVRTAHEMLERPALRAPWPRGGRDLAHLPDAPLGNASPSSIRQRHGIMLQYHPGAQWQRQMHPPMRSVAPSLQAVARERQSSAT